MPIDLVALVTRWTRSSNRRVLLEELVRALAWLAIVTVVALGLHLAPEGVAALQLPWPAWLPTETATTQIAIGLGSVAALFVIGRTIVRVRRRRIDALGMARRLDEQRGTEDLFATALAVEAGTVSGSAEVQQVVRGRALDELRQVQHPLPSFRTPMTVIAGAVAVVGIAAALPWLLTEIAELTITPAEAAQADDAQAEEAALDLDADTKERIDKAIAQLERYEKNPALRREAQEQLAAAREHLQRALSDPKQAPSSLSRAEQALRKLAKEARRKGLFDPEQLSEMSNENLTKAMSEAMKQGEHDTAAELGKELSRRMEKASEPELQRMAEAFRRQFPPTTTPPRTPSPEGENKEGEGKEGENKAGEGKEGEGKRETAEERRERWNKQLEQMAEDMKRGESGLSSSEMRKLAEELRKAAERGSGSLSNELDRTFGDVRGARRRHLDRMGREREGKAGEGKPGEGKSPGSGKPGEGKGPGAGKPSEGKGPGAGKPGEGKGPGSGKGPGEGKPGGEGMGEGDGPPSGKPGPGGGAGQRRYGFLPPSSVPPGDRVDVPSGGPPKGAVRIIQRAAQGPGRETKEYADIHNEYEAVAEAAVRREEIPLTRRDYIREYFQAVRPH